MISRLLSPELRLTTLPQTKMGDSEAIAKERCLERSILSEHDLTLKESHSFDDLVMKLHPQATEVTERLRMRLMILIFDE